MIVEITEELESGLTEAERQVIEYINQHEDQFLKLTITELAEKEFYLSSDCIKGCQKVWV